MRLMSQRIGLDAALENRQFSPKIGGLRLERKFDTYYNSRSLD